MSDISNKEIMQDILDTKAEINIMEQEIKGFKLLGDKLSIYKADAREAGIQERLHFITKLENILMKRKQTGGGDE